MVGQTPDLRFQVVWVAKDLSQARAARGSGVHWPCPCFTLERRFCFLEIHFLWRDVWVHLLPSLPMCRDPHIHTHMNTHPRSQSISPRQAGSPLSTGHTQRPRKVCGVLGLKSLPIRTSFLCSALISTRPVYLLLQYQQKPALFLL